MMKVYFLRLTSDDFVQDGDRWVSDVVDLYDNDSYTNFSVTKSSYGLVGANQTWIGTKRTSDLVTWDDYTPLTWGDLDTWPDQGFNTDTGWVENGRYIDTSGRIDIVSYNINATASSLEMMIYSNDTDDDEHYANEWEHNEPRKTSEVVEYIDVNRYAKFVLNTVSGSLPADLKLYVRIEIDLPIMTPMYRPTYKLLNKFPEWMDLHEKIPTQPLEEVEKPSTVGGGFLNAVAGEWLEDITRELSYRDFQRYISTVDLDQMAWAYRVSISDVFVDEMLPVIVISVVGDEVPLAQVADWAEFLRAIDDDAYYLDYDERTIYTTKLYDELLINGTAYDQSTFHVRNYVDEIGTFVDLDRLHLEDNTNYSLRILDVYRNRGGVGVESLKFGLRRELDLWKQWGAYVGEEPPVDGAEDPVGGVSLIAAAEGLIDNFSEWQFYLRNQDEETIYYDLSFGLERWDGSEWVEIYAGDDPQPTIELPPEDEVEGATGESDPQIFAGSTLEAGWYRIKKGFYLDEETYEVRARLYISASLPEILDMDDIEADPKYFNDDGMPTKEFVELVEDLSWKYPTTWGRFRWNEALWDAGGGEEDYHPGYGLVPYRYDQEMVDERYLQSGVGDGDDLFVFRPDVVTGPRDITTTLKVRGRRRVTRTEYPGVDVSFKIRGRGLRDHYNNPVKNIWLTAEITTTNASDPLYVASFLMSAQSDVAVDQPQPSEESYTLSELFAEDAGTTSANLNFVHPATNFQYNDTGVIPVENIQQVTLKQGRWVAGQYQNLETMNHYEVWFSHDEDNKLTQPGSSAISFGYVEDELEQPLVVMKSLLVATPVAVDWFSDEYTYEETINGISPYTSPGPPVVVDIPQIFWDPYATNRSIEITLTSDDGDGNYGGFTEDNDGEEVFIPASLIRLNGNGTWTNGTKNLVPATVSFELTTGTQANVYPITFDTWELFEEDQLQPFPGVVDENGPWRNNSPQRPGTNLNYTLISYENLKRTDFGIPNDSDYVITWIGVEGDNDRVITWIDTNVIVPIDDLDANVYPSDAIEEHVLNDVYYFDPIRVYARLRPMDPRWVPQVHSGYFYDKADEYYFYADKQIETADSDEYVLEKVARQGAPIVVENGSTNLRQVAFFDRDVSPPVLSLTNTEEIIGTGTENLYLAYTGVHDVEVFDPEGVSVGSFAEVSSNKITLDEPTERGETYSVTYKVNDSFYADHSYVDPTSGLQRTRLVFDSVGEYTITYETSNYDPATPVDISLNPLHTTQHEGFVYISFNEYTLESIHVRVNPAKILADGVDYIVITIRSYDKNGNPKADQDFTISSTYGVLDGTAITTDHDGFAVVTLRSTDNYTADTGTIDITGEVNASFDFEIEERTDPTAKLFAIPSSEQIVADGTSKVLVYGKIENEEFQPVSGVTVSWKQGRSLYELFTNTQIYDSGTVTTNAQGTFVIGPFNVQESEQSGYWFIMAQATVGGNEIGDIVFWYEYPDTNHGVEGIDGLPRPPVQMQIPPNTYPQMASSYRYPVTYNEQASTPSGTATINWEPPAWYAIDGYTQYQTGLTGHKNENHI